MLAKNRVKMLILQSSKMPHPQGWRVPAPTPGAGAHRPHLLSAPVRGHFCLVPVLQESPYLLVSALWVT